MSTGDAIGSCTNTNECTARTSNSVSVGGGSGSYTYSWSIDNGNINIVSPSSSSTSFTAAVFCWECGDTVQYGTARCDVYDTVYGVTGSATCSVNLENTRTYGSCTCL